MGQIVQALGVALGRLFKSIFIAVFTIAAGSLLIGGVIYGLWTVVIPGAVTTGTGIVASLGTLLRLFGVPPAEALAGNAIAGALAGLVIGMIRFRQRRHSPLAERVVEILSEPELLSFRRLGVATIAAHIAAGVAAGALLAWVGFPDPGLAAGLMGVRDTPLVVWAVGGGGFGGGGFGGGGYGLLALAPWAALLWFAMAALVLCALFTSVTLVSTTVVAAIVSSVVSSASSATTLSLALALAPALPDSPFRDGQVFMRERVEAAISRDEGRAMMIWGAAVSGAATGLLTATLTIIWTTVTGT